MYSMRTVDVVKTVVSCTHSSQEAHIAKLASNLDSSGDASLQNGLDMSIGALKAIPPYGHREASPCCDPQKLVRILYLQRHDMQASSHVSLHGDRADAKQPPQRLVQQHAQDNARLALFPDCSFQA